MTCSIRQAGSTGRRMDAHTAFRGYQDPPIIAFNAYEYSQLAEKLQWKYWQWWNVYLWMDNNVSVGKWMAICKTVTMEDVLRFSNMDHWEDMKVAILGASLISRLFPWSVSCYWREMNPVDLWTKNNSAMHVRLIEFPLVPACIANAFGNKNAICSLS